MDTLTPTASSLGQCVRPLIQTGPQWETALQTSLPLGSKQECKILCLHNGLTRRTTLPGGKGKQALWHLECGTSLALTSIYNNQHDMPSCADIALWLKIDYMQTVSAAIGTRFNRIQCNPSQANRFRAQATGSW